MSFGPSSSYMKVKDLIEILSRADPEACLVVTDEDLNDMVSENCAEGYVPDYVHKIESARLGWVNDNVGYADFRFSFDFNFFEIEGANRNPAVRLFIAGDSERLSKSEPAIAVISKD